MWTSILRWGLEARSIYLRPRNSISFAEVSFNIFRNVLSSAKRLLSLPFIWRSQEVLHLLEQPQPTGLNLRREKGEVAKAGVTQLHFVQFGQKNFRSTDNCGFVLRWTLFITCHFSWWLAFSAMYYVILIHTLYIPKFLPSTNNQQIMQFNRLGYLNLTVSAF